MCPDVSLSAVSMTVVWEKHQSLLSGLWLHAGKRMCGEQKKQNTLQQLLSDNNLAFYKLFKKCICIYMQICVYRDEPKYKIIMRLRANGLLEQVNSDFGLFCLIDNTILN